MSELSEKTLVFRFAINTCLTCHSKNILKEKKTKIVEYAKNWMKSVKGPLCQFQYTRQNRTELELKITWK